MAVFGGGELCLHHRFMVTFDLKYALQKAPQPLYRTKKMPKILREKSKNKTKKTSNYSQLPSKKTQRVPTAVSKKRHTPEAKPQKLLQVQNRKHGRRCLSLTRPRRTPGSSPTWLFRSIRLRSASEPEDSCFSVLIDTFREAPLRQGFFFRSLDIFC